MPAADVSALFAFIMGGLALFGSPGPAIVSLFATGTAFGARAGLGYLAGIIAGTLADAVLVVSGLSALVLALPAVKPALFALAALYILYLAFKIATAPVLGTEIRDARAPGLGAGLMLAMTNPKAYAALAALFSSVRLLPGPVAPDAIAKLTVLLAVILVTDGGWLLLGGLLRGRKLPARLTRGLNIVLALLLVVSMAWAGAGLFAD